MSLSKENKVIIDGVTYYGGLNQPNLKFVKVNVDCWEKVFDYLSLQDILNMSATCLRMRQIGGHYFRENFHGTDCFLSPQIISSKIPSFGVTDSSNIGNRAEVKQEDFLRFADTVRLSSNIQNDDYDLYRLEHYVGKNLMVSLRTLHLYGTYSSANEFPGLANMLNNIENIEISLAFASTRGRCFGQFLASCPKLKVLRMRDLNFFHYTAHNSMFQRVFPMLADFECTDCPGLSEFLTSFLELNPSIKTLRIGINDLWEIQSEWTSTIRLDCLDIRIGEMYRNWNEYVERIKVLHANGHFKTLHINLCYDSEYGLEEFIGEITSIVKEMASFSALEALSTYHVIDNICLLTQLKELHFKLVDDENIDLEPVAKNLINLERLWIDCTVDQFLPFLRHSKNLKVAIFEGTGYNSALDLHNLNEERQLGGAKQKVKIGAYENIYLATKWKTINVDYDLVEICRTETLREQFVYNNLHNRYL